MDPDVFPQIPHDTANIAGLIFDKGNFYMLVGDQANRLFSGFQWQDSILQVENPKHTLAMFYLITYFQLMESLPDHAAADALNNRINWKYALHLPLNFSGWDAYLFCDFRKWLLEKQSRQQDMEKLIVRLSEMSPAIGKPVSSLKTDQALTHICLLSRLEVIYLTINQVSKALAAHHPQLLQEVSLPNWYALLSDPDRIGQLSMDRSDLESHAQSIGTDGVYMLNAISAEEISGLVNLPEIQLLNQVWRDQYVILDGKVQWRKQACAHCPSIVKNQYFKNISTDTSGRTYERKAMNLPQRE